MHVSDEVGGFLRSIKVFEMDLNKIRVGSKHDGGYVVMRQLCETTPAVYSFGVGEDIEFELDFDSRFSANTFMLFDPFVFPGRRPDNFEFVRTGIDPGYHMLRSAPDGSLLKIDVEWNEWEALYSNLDARTLSRFSQLVVEFHVIHAETPSWLTTYFYSLYDTVLGTVNKRLFWKYKIVMEKMNEIFYCSHIHANNSLPVVKLGGYQFPPLMEMTFVRKDLVKRAHLTTTRFPVPHLDAPNKTDRPDIIGFYPFRKEKEGLQPFKEVGHAAK
jgi:hypothetical protein